MDTTEDTRDLARPMGVVETLNSFRDPWDFALLVECFFGVRRFEDFVARLPISRNVLSKRLQSLVAQGVLERVLYQTKPDRFEYRLSEKGRDLYPIFTAIMRWGERWIPDSRPDGWELVHSCGEECRPVTVCDACLQPIAVRDIKVVAPGRAEDTTS